MSRLVVLRGRVARGGPRPATLRPRSWGLLGVALVLLSSCAYDRAEEVRRQPPAAAPCDSVAVSFAAAVAPLLQQRCLSCHNRTRREGNLVLETHAQVQQAAASGRLLGAITHAPGFTPMPLNEAQLAACDIARIRQWIRAGTPNN